MRWWLVRSVLWAGQSVGAVLFVCVESFTADLWFAIRGDPALSNINISGFTFTTSSIITITIDNLPPCPPIEYMFVLGHEIIPL